MMLRRPVQQNDERRGAENDRSTKRVPHPPARCVAMCGPPFNEFRRNRYRLHTRCDGLGGERGRSGRDPLVVPERKAAFEVGLEFNGSATDMPRAVRKLR